MFIHSPTPLTKNLAHEMTALGIPRWHALPRRHMGLCICWPPPLNA